TPSDLAGGEGPKPQTSTEPHTGLRTHALSLTLSPGGLGRGEKQRSHNQLPPSPPQLIISSVFVIGAWTWHIWNTPINSCATSSATPKPLLWSAPAKSLTGTAIGSWLICNSKAIG